MNTRIRLFAIFKIIALSLIILYPLPSSAQLLSDGHKHIRLGDIDFQSLQFGDAFIEYESALKIYLDAFGLYHPLVANIYIKLGNTYLEIGDFDNAKLYIQNGLNSIRGAFPREGAIAGKCYLSLGNIAQGEEKYEEALFFYQKAYAIHQELWGDDFIGSYPIHIVFANFYLKRKNYDKFQEHFAIYKENKPKEDDKYLFSYWTIYNELLGNWHTAQNQIDSAIIYYDRAVNFFEENVGFNYPIVSKLRFKLGDAFFSQENDLDQAMNHYTQALRLFEGTHACDCPVPLGIDSCMCNMAFLRSITGQAKINEKKFEKSSDIEHLKKSLELYQTVANKLIKAIKYYSKEPIYRRKLLHENKAAFIRGIRVAEQLYQLTNSEIYVQKAFMLVSQYKGLTLELERKMELVTKREGVSENSLQELQEKRAAVAQQQRAVYMATQQNSQNLSKEKQQLAQTQLEYSNFLRSFRSDYQGIEDSIFNKSLVAFDEIPMLLDENTILINYVVDSKANQLYTFSFSTKKVDFQAISIPSSFQKEVEKFHTLLQSSLLPRADKKRQFIQKGHELYQLLIEPVAAQIDNKKKLIIIRDDVLHKLPFETLLTTNRQNNFVQMDYLLYDFEITYHYSTELWANSLFDKWEENGDNLLAFAPVFDSNEDRRDIQQTRSNTWSVFRSAILGEKHPALPHSEKEVNTIAQIFDNSSNNTILLRESANETQLKQHLEQSYRLVHIASHSFANQVHSQFSGVACFEETTDSEEDGILFINEIENLKINADLVVLSSCESGIGQLMQGEGLLGLNRSFLFAGVPNTIFSLWAVQDKVTSEFMIAFYKNIKQDMDYGQALQQAKLMLLANTETASPNFWAGFILMGR